MFVNGWNSLIQIYYIPSFYQLVYGYSAVKSGALLLPITLTQSKLITPANERVLIPLKPCSAPYRALWCTGQEGIESVYS
jgi:hypothetical protein